MVYAIKGKVPRVSEKAGFIAPSADVIGDIVLEEGVSIWFNAVLRGDKDRITIKKHTNIQDGAVVHADPGVPCTVGEGVTVGHSAVLHGCTIGRNCLIGMNAVVLNGVEIGDNCLIGANSLVPSGMKIPSGSLVLGSPAKVVKELKPSMKDAIRKSVEGYMSNSMDYLEELAAVEDLLE